MFDVVGYEIMIIIDICQSESFIYFLDVKLQLDISGNRYSRHLNICLRLFLSVTTTGVLRTS